MGKLKLKYQRYRNILKKQLEIQNSKIQKRDIVQSTKKKKKNKKTKKTTDVYFSKLSVISIRTQKSRHFSIEENKL